VTSHGLWAFFSNNLRFVGNTLHDTDNGIIMSSNRRVLIEGNDFRRIPRPSYKADGGDGIQANTMVKLTIRRNTFDEFPAHPHTDSIEFAGSNDQVTIDANVWHQCRGVISVPHPHRPAPYSNTNWKITNNEFTFLTQWALELNNVPDALIANNTAWSTGHGIRLHGLTSGVVMANNITDVAAADKASFVGRSTGNVIGALETKYPLGSSDVLGKPAFGDPAKLNFRLLAGSLGIDIGAADVAPKRDRLGRERFGRPDAGAYEFRPG
jgi:parallel beta helix pectate lyase-like protein